VTTFTAVGGWRARLFVAALLALGAARGFAVKGQTDQAEPDLSEPSAIEQALMEQACLLVRGNVADSRPYDECLRTQILALRTAFGRDLGKLTSAERRTIDARCRSGSVAQTRDAYLTCLGGRLQALRVARGFAPVPAPASAAPPATVAPVPSPASPASEPGTTGGVSQAWMIAAGVIVVAGILAAVKAGTRRRTCTTCGVATPDADRLCETCRRKAATAELWASAEREERERAQANEQQEARERKERMLPPDIFDPYAVLGVARTASKEEIRTAYKDAMTKYHPDKVAHLGEELQDVAREKAQALNRAYRLLN
jgi:hypothetical protein